MSYQDDVNEVRAFYDSQKSVKMRRREELRLELEKRLEEEDQAAAEGLARLLHHKFNLGVTKKDLRWATRQYQSPSFKEIWDAVEYVAPEGRKGPDTPPVKSEGFVVEGEEITFRKGSGDWEWDGIGSEELTFTIRESTNSGNLSLTWKADQVDHALFNMKNLAAVTVALKGVEL